MMKFRKAGRALGALAFVAGAVGVIASPASATHVTCGSVITEDVTLDSDLGPCPGDELIVRADDVTVDLNGFRTSRPTARVTTPASGWGWSAA